MIEILPGRFSCCWNDLGSDVHVHAGAVTIDGWTIPPLPSGAVDVRTLRRAFRPKRSPHVYADGDSPLGDVVAVIAPYANNELTDPVLELDPMP